MNPNYKIGDLIELPPIQTVIKLEDGESAPDLIAESFVFTPEVDSHIAVISDSLSKSTGQGFFLQGDFGSGKSHFLAVLSAWLADRSGTEKLTEAHGGLKRLKEAGKKILPVDISLLQYRSNTSLEDIIIKRIEQKLSSTGKRVSLTPLSIFLEHLESMLAEPESARAFAEEVGVSGEDLRSWIWENPREAYSRAIPIIKRMGLNVPEALVEERHETFDRVITTLKDSDYHGMILLIDELSEFFRSKPSANALNEDARTLQYIGELAGTEPVWIIGAVQESIEKAGDIADHTFRKIKDRFPIKLILSTAHIRSLIEKRLVKHKPGADESIFKIYETYREQYITFKCEFDEFRRIYPVHPETIALLDGLGELFSIHRGIVDFIHSQIAGDNRRNISGILERPCTELLAPDSIYDHFSQRLAEYSSFNVYTRHIVPHLDEVIESELDQDERSLARRLIRMLVLYRIHPTASTPSVRQLTELVGLSLASPDAELSVEFIAGAVLDPLVERSRFLSKQYPDSGDPLDTVYTISTEEDPTKTFKARMSRMMEEIAPGDTRLILVPFSEMQESASWPGPQLLKDIMERTVDWRLSRRKALVAFVHRDEADSLAFSISRELESGKADFAVVLSFGRIVFDCPFTAVWKLTIPESRAEILKEYLAANLLYSTLSPSNPADAPLLGHAEECIEKLRPGAHQAALNTLYSGNFSNILIEPDAAMREMMRFDRILEIAANCILEERYSGFAEIAPRRLLPTPRHYQRLLDEFVFTGSIAMGEARSKGLSEAIDALAAPLGLAELKRGSYIFSPDPNKNSLLTFLFSLLESTGPVSKDKVLASLRTGRFGLPEDTIRFLLAALAMGGLISLLKSGRTLPVDFLRLTSIDSADSIAPGEIIGEEDRETLLRECPFLLPSTRLETFGLRQQREAWQAVIRFRDSASRMIEEIQERMKSLSQFQAFKFFDRESFERKISGINTLLKEIRVSYSPREGLERFLRTWRGTGLSGDDIEFFKKLNRFLKERAEAFISINHYIRHPVVQRICRENEELLGLKDGVEKLLINPEKLIHEELTSTLLEAFTHFRERYILFYKKKHSEYYEKRKKPSLSKYTLRAVSVLRRLASIEVLDRPEGVKDLLDLIDRPEDGVCNRNINEELLRSPVCTCGYKPGDEIFTRIIGEKELDSRVQRALEEYVKILKAPEIIEAVTARAYALGQVDEKATAQLKRFLQASKGGGLSPSSLLNLAEETTVSELEKALSGRVEIRRRSLETLRKQLSGRRLAPQQVREVVNRWVGETVDNTVIAIEDEDREYSQAGSSLWWLLLQNEKIKSSFSSEVLAEESVREIESTLENRFPSSKIQETFKRIGSNELLDFILKEHFHLHAVRRAFNIFAERILSGESLPEGWDRTPSLTNREAGEELKSVLGTLSQIADTLNKPFPQRLRVRLHALRLSSQAYATRELKKAVTETIKKTEELGVRWLSELPVLTPIDLKETPIVMVLDGVSPDVWLEVWDALGEETLFFSGRRGETKWYRLDSAPVTVEAMGRLFGFEGDPSDEFAVRGIGYYHINGREERPLFDLIDEPEEQKPVVIRVTLLDEEAHSSSTHLQDMPALLISFFKTGFRSLKDFCQENARPLVICTDHGLSVTRSGLSHGKGGVYEQAVFKIILAQDDGQS